MSSLKLSKLIFSFFLIFLLANSLFAKNPDTCYSVQLLSSKKIIPYSKKFPQGSQLMHIGGVYTIRNGCYETVKTLKKDFAELTKGFPNALIVSTYRYRFHKKQQTTLKRKNQNKLPIKKEKKKKSSLNFIPCIRPECKQNRTIYPWENLNRIEVVNLLPQTKIETIIPSTKNTYDKNKIQKDTNESKIPDFYRFYINPYLSAYSGQTAINGEKLYLNTEKLALGFQYLHFFNNLWYFYTDMRIIPYRAQNNSRTKSNISFDIKEFYLQSNQLWNNQANFLLGRKILKDRRSWYYHSALDTIGIFNKHDLLLYEFYAGTRLNSNIIIDGTTSSKYDLKDTKFLIAHISYEYFIANKIELFGLYEESATQDHRKLHWIGLRTNGKLKNNTIQNISYWFDIAKVSGTIQNTTVKQKLNGTGIELGGAYHFKNIQDTIALSYAYGSGGSNLYEQSHLTNNRSDFLSKHLFIRYYGSFFDPELSNIHIKSLYYSHILDNPEYTFMMALHNYKQDTASSSQYTATSYTVHPNGLSTDLGNELDCILGAYFKDQYDWRFVLAYFMGGSAYNNVASNKDGFYGQINFRYYW